jgi:hypothetical protein
MPTTGSEFVAIVESVNGEPLILNYHTRRDCARLLEEVNDPDLDRLRDITRYPDRISEILLGSFQPPRGFKDLIALIATGRVNEFRDREGAVHIIAPCRLCANDE